MYSFVDFLIGLFIYSFESSLYTISSLDFKHKSDICFANIFFHSVSYIFTFLIMFFDAISKFDEIHFFVFSLSF